MPADPGKSVNGTSPGLLLKLLQRTSQDRVIGCSRCGKPECRVGGRHRCFGVMEQRLAQFFAGTQPNELELDIAVGPEPGEADHLTRQIDDPDRLPHLQNEDLAT